MRYIILSILKSFLAQRKHSDVCWMNKWKYQCLPFTVQHLPTNWLLGWIYSLLARWSPKLLQIALCLVLWRMQSGLWLNYSQLYHKKITVQVLQWRTTHTLYYWEPVGRGGDLGELGSECPISRGSHNWHPTWEYRMKLPIFQKFLKYGILLKSHNLKLLSTLSISECYQLIKILFKTLCRSNKTHLWHDASYKRPFSNFGLHA